MRRIAILGSTGSIGRQALDLVDAYPDRFSVCGLATNTNIDLLTQQAARFHPEVVSCGAAELATDLEAMIGASLRGGRPPIVASGILGLRQVAAESSADIVLAATDGLVACGAVFAAVERGIDVALANKEIVVAAGAPLFLLAGKSGARILPVDSEHSAVYQCLMGERPADIRSIVLTASGGPFWSLAAEDFAAITPVQALNHPTWTMGPKNTIDSATLMNKGLEVIEACRFFSLTPRQVEVVIHRQSIAHAFVIFSDGSVKSQLAAPDMRMPIGFALAYPDRLPEATGLARTRAALGLAGEGVSLTFEPVDGAKFPCLGLAYRAIEKGGTYPAVLSAANEEAGRAFLGGKVRFVDIAAITAAALGAHVGGAAELPDITEADRWARTFTQDAISSLT